MHWLKLHVMRYFLFMISIAYFTLNVTSCISLHMMKELRIFLHILYSGWKIYKTQCDFCRVFQIARFYVSWNTQWIKSRGILSSFNIVYYINYFTSTSEQFENAYFSTGINSCDCSKTFIFKIITRKSRSV